MRSGMVWSAQPKFLSLAGHTLGMQGVLVNAALCSIASDTLGLFETREEKWRHKHIPSSNHYDLVEYHKTFEEIERTRDHILPGPSKQSTPESGNSEIDLLIGQ